MGRENPLRWNCSERGCFNIKKRPKIEVFAECFPGNIQMGDVDGIVEIGGRFLMLEWKQSGAIAIGQRIMYEQITRSSHCHVIVVIGDPETMIISRYAYFWQGRMSDWHDGTIEKVKELMGAWAQAAVQAQQQQQIKAPIQTQKRQEPPRAVFFVPVAERRVEAVERLSESLEGLPVIAPRSLTTAGVPHRRSFRGV